MAPSQLKLADALNGLVEAGRVSVSETRTNMAVNQLNGAEADSILLLFDDAGWGEAIAADAGGEIPRDMVAGTGEGVRVTAIRPPLPDGVDAAITKAGLAALLDRVPACSIVWVEGLDRAIDTKTVRYAPWGNEDVFTPSGEIANPAKVVRILGQKSLPGNLGMWLLETPDTEVSAHCMAPWRTKAVERLLTALAQEIEVDGRILFRGPPPTRFGPVTATQDIEASKFAAIQAAVGWVYENERELENRHGLLAAEIARSSLRDGTCQDLASVLDLALEGGRIAYNFGITQQSKDTLKALSDLRKAVTDDVSKLSETIRSLGAAVAAAVFGNIGLIVARLTLPENSKFVGPAAELLGIVLTLYVFSVIVSGFHYISIQRGLREDWRGRLYRFLRDEEYERMVNSPAKRAERAFYVIAAFGGAMAILLLAAVYFIVSDEHASALISKELTHVTPATTGNSSVKADP